MTIFRYVAKERPGEKQEGYVEAGSREEALQKLSGRGLAALRLSEAGEKKVPATGWKAAVPPVEKTNAMRQIADLLDAGVPLPRAIRLVGAQSKRPALTEALGAIGTAIDQGLPLSDGMSKNPALFGPIAIAMIRAGEKAGAVAPVLARIADQGEREEEIRARVKGAMVYPLFILAVGILTSGFLLYFVVPRLASLITESGQRLPWPTRCLLGLSDAARGPALVAFPVVLVGTGIAVSLSRGRLERVRPVLDEWVQRLPIWGAIVRKGMIARFANVLAALLEGSVPILDALSLAADALGQSALRRALGGAIADVRQGVALSAALSKTGVMPPDLCQMVAVGEEGDGLVPSLRKIAQSYERRMDRALAVFSSLIEPVLILMVGGMTALLVAALLLPVFEVTANVR